jgi:hypothetical protein
MGVKISPDSGCQLKVEVNQISGHWVLLPQNPKTWDKIRPVFCYQIPEGKSYYPIAERSKKPESYLIEMGTCPNPVKPWPILGTGQS